MESLRCISCNGTFDTEVHGRMNSLLFSIFQPNSAADQRDFTAPKSIFVGFAALQEIVFSALILDGIFDTEHFAQQSGAEPAEARIKTAVV